MADDNDKFYLITFWQRSLHLKNVAILLACSSLNGVNPVKALNTLKSLWAKGKPPKLYFYEK